MAASRSRFSRRAAAPILRLCPVATSAAICAGAKTQDALRDGFPLEQVFGWPGRHARRFSAPQALWDMHPPRSARRRPDSGRRVAAAGTRSRTRHRECAAAQAPRLGQDPQCDRLSAGAAAQASRPRSRPRARRTRRCHGRHASYPGFSQPAQPRSAAPRPMQNSFPSGSANTTHPVPSARRRSSTTTAPRRVARSTCSSRLVDVGQRSKWMRFFAVFSSGTRRNNSPD